MGYLIFNNDEGDMRSNMRRSMRSGSYRNDGYTPMMREDGKEHWYRTGYRHGWEDKEDDMDEEYRRRRDSRGRYM